MLTSIIPGARGARGEGFAHLAGLLPALILALGCAEKVRADEPDREDLLIYAFCTAEAEISTLGGGQAQACAEAFLRIKLAFLPDIGFEDIATLSPSDRAEANRAGYSALMVWRARRTGSAAGGVSLARE